MAGKNEAVAHMAKPMHLEGKWPKPTIYLRRKQNVYRKEVKNCPSSSSALPRAFSIKRTTKFNKALNRIFP
ncbi:hypothetical protein HDF10_002962 [Edaphobacter lichenicola]|uniref:Uncharacterized protein n=1 Tax=Tunturiibacter lichenicola TaxID=2051959 RepID=A0A7W8JBG4_9BACT|nr:hypothetical protein [Edaphobacter lichenicola]